MVELGVDEITLVLQLNFDSITDFDPLDWKYYAKGLLDEFEDKAKLKTVFGEKTQLSKGLLGYTNAFTYGDHSFHFAVAYHEMNLRMGVLIKFSAQAFDYYCNNMQFNTYKFLQSVQSTKYSTRLSRIDFTADYINEDIIVTSIYQGFLDNTIGIFKEKYNNKKNEMYYSKLPLKYRGFIIGTEVPTLYIGSNKSNSALRVYDKRQEQIKTKGTKLDKAIGCENWVRFEAVFKNTYAHQLTEELLKVKSDDEYANLIAITIYKKFKFMTINNGVVDCDTYYTQLLFDLIKNHNFKLSSKSSKNYELAKNINYIFQGSGIISTLYKINSIWGSDAVVYILNMMNEYVECMYYPNDDCRMWLKKHKLDYQKGHQDFSTFLNDFM